MNQKHTSFIGLGTNLGDKEQNIQNAIKQIEKQGEIIKKSTIYASEPWGFESSSIFYNSVIQIETRLTTSHLFQFLKEIESTMGRVKTNFENYEDRIIDLDILFYDDCIFSDEVLTIPHKQICNRKFVLEPLNEIASDFIHPTKKKSIANLLLECTDISVLKQITSKL